MQAISGCIAERIWPLSLSSSQCPRLQSHRGREREAQLFPLQPLLRKQLSWTSLYSNPSFQLSSRWWKGKQSYSIITARAAAIFGLPQLTSNGSNSNTLQSQVREKKKSRWLLLGALLTWAFPHLSLGCCHFIPFSDYPKCFPPPFLFLFLYMAHMF